MSSWFESKSRSKLTIWLLYAILFAAKKEEKVESLRKPKPVYLHLICPDWKEDSGLFRVIYELVKENAPKVPCDRDSRISIDLRPKQYRRLRQLLEPVIGKQSDGMFRVALEEMIPRWMVYGGTMKVKSNRQKTLRFVAMPW
jgi:hypothetical protein